MQGRFGDAEDLGKREGKKKMQWRRNLGCELGTGDEKGRGKPRCGTVVNLASMRYIEANAVPGVGLRLLLIR